MNRRVLLFVATLLPAALFLLSPLARAQTRPPGVEDPPPPFADRFPQPLHETAPLLPRGGAQRRSASLTKEEKRLLAVPGEDRELYADFLKQPRTGIVRLLPRETYERKLALRGGGAYYSFVDRTHEYGYGSDIELQRGQLSVGFAGADFGFMFNLGDAPLEDVSVETEAVQFMASFETPSNEPEAREAQRQFMGRKGQQVGQWSYKNRLPVVVGGVYALRSVNYESSDVLVAFRVVRQDADGSVVLLWKLLKNYRRPSLNRGIASSFP